MDETARAITVEQSVRPLRLAFLVDPQERGSIRRAISCNTGQWGGIFNPLIPVYRRRPTWWRARLPFPEWAPSAADLAAGAIESWDPDFIVECRTDRRPIPGVDVPVLDLGALCNHHFHESEDRGRGPAGVSMRFIIQQLHEDFFRFQRAVGPEPVVVGADPGIEDVAAAAFGSFGAGEGLRLEATYRDLTGASDVSLSAAYLLGLLGYGEDELRLAPPLDLNTHKLSVYWPFHRSDGVVFLMSPAEGIDIIDFWNLRAMGKRVIPVPVEFFSDLQPQLAAGIEKISGGEGRPISLVAGRRVSAARLETFRAGFNVGNEAVFDPGLQIWDYKLEADNLERPEIAAAEAEDIVELSRGRVEVPIARPRITRRGTAPNLKAWASVVRLKADFRADDLACAFDPRLGSVSEVLEARQPRAVRAREEGLVSIVDLEDKIDWRAPSGTELFSWYARGAEVEPRLSEPGSIATEMVRRLGGIGRLGLIRHPALVALMEKASNAETGTVKYEEVKRATLEAREGDAERADGLLSILLERRVLQIGLFLECPRCSKQNWYSPEEMSTWSECSRCLDRFPFPAVKPPRKWGYKPRGGFAAPGFARGSYSVLFSLGALSNLAARGSWWPSLSLGRGLEMDFGFWAQNDPLPGRTASEWTLFLGEAKTHNKFDGDDVARAEALRRRFPGCVIVFSTLRDELSPEEKSLLGAFARPSNRDDAPDRADVIVFTSLELYTGESLTGAWQEAGGKAAEVAPRQMGRRPWGAAVADITQQFHLDLPQYERWRFPEAAARL
jgi:hypothetical protein